MSFRPKGRSPRRPFHPKRFEHGASISKIDTRPIMFLAALLVVVIGTSRYGVPILSPEVDLPTMEAKPIHQLDKSFVVTVTTTEAESRASLWERVSSANHGECRAYLGNGMPVTGYELYDYAFTLLDSTIIGGGGVEYVFVDPDRPQAIIPTFYVRADKTVPWRCIGGAISNLERAGYPTIGLLTTPIS